MTRTSAIMNTDAFAKPYLSYRTPDTVGPMKAPKAKDEVHNPEIIPYVSKSLARPDDLKNISVSKN